MDFQHDISQTQLNEPNFRKTELMPLKVENLRCFVEVAQCGSLSEAAYRLGRTQSALSMTLKQLEEHLGRKLFEGERKNKLSPFGEQVLDLASVQVRQFDLSVEAIEAAAASDHGLLRIVSIPSIAAMVFPKVLGHIRDRHPGLKVELRDADTLQVKSALMDGSADIGIASGRQKLNGVETQPMFQDRFGLVVSSSQRLMRQEAPVQIRQVFEEPFIRTELCDLIENDEVRAQTAQADFTIRNTQSLVSLIQTGEWTTILPEAVGGILPSGCSFRPIAGLDDVRDVSLYLKRDTRNADVVAGCAAFIEALDLSGRSFMQ